MFNSSKVFLVSSKVNNKVKYLINNYITNSIFNNDIDCIPNHADNTTKILN